MHLKTNSDVEELMKVLEQISQTSAFGLNQARHIAESAMREQYRREAVRASGS